MLKMHLFLLTGIFLIVTSCFQEPVNSFDLGPSDLDEATNSTIYTAPVYEGTEDRLSTGFFYEGNHTDVFDLSVFNIEIWASTAVLEATANKDLVIEGNETAKIIYNTSTWSALVVQNSVNASGSADLSSWSNVNFTIRTSSENLDDNLSFGIYDRSESGHIQTLGDISTGTNISFTIPMSSFSGNGVDLTDVIWVRFNTGNCGPADVWYLDELYFD